MPQFYTPLESNGYVASSTKQVRLDLLPAGARVYELHLFFDLTGTKASGDTLTADLFPRFVQSLKVGRFVNIDGWGLSQLMAQVYGRAVGKGADIGSGSTTFAAQFELIIPFRNPRQPGTSDGAIPSELLHGKSIEIVTAAGNVHGVGSLTATAGNIRAFAEMVYETNIPQLGEIGYKDPGSQTVQLEAGVYLDLFLCDGPTPGTVTQAEVSTIDMTVDGQPVYTNALHEQIVSAYNASAPRDATGAVTINAATRLPLIWQDTYGKAEITKQPAIEKSGRLQITGTMNAPRLYYWRSLPKDPATVQAVAAAIGAPTGATEYEPTTASKGGLRSVKEAPGGAIPKKGRLASAVLPGKLRKPGTANP